MNNKIYIVVADTYGGGYGEKITCLYADTDIEKCIDFVKRHINSRMTASYMCAKEADFVHEHPYPEFIRAITLGERQDVLLGGYIE